MRRFSIGTQIFVTLFIVAIFAIISVSWYASGISRDFYLEKTAETLKNQAYLIDHLLKTSNLQNPAELQEKINNAGKDIAIRITIIDEQGVVIADSESDPSSLDNHSKRPEILAALNNAEGKSIRYSNSVERNMMYFAIHVKSPSGRPVFIRTSKTLSIVENTIAEMQSRILLAGLIIASIAISIGFLVSKRITGSLERIILGVERFANGDFSKKLARPYARETALLSDSLNKMAAQIDEKIETVTRQKKEQNAVLESMSEGVIAVDHNGAIIWINSAAFKLFSITRSNVKGTNIREAIDNIQIENLFLKVLKKGQAQEDEIILADQKKLHLKLNTQVLVDDSGNVIGALMVIDDLTRLKHLEQGRREFVANVSHELRTPLTTIMGFAEALYEGGIKDEENTRHFIEIIFKQSNRLSNILEDILTLSRLDMGEEVREIEMVEENIRDILKNAIQMCQFNADKKNIRIIFNDNCGYYLKINRQLIEEALINLIDNAVKYSPENTQIQIDCKTENGELVISVADQGTGIAQEYLSRIFERFYRVDKARSRKGGGTGLGLAIVKHIALAHKGHVDVKSEIGHGSTFTISLPFNISSKQLITS